MKEKDMKGSKIWNTNPLIKEGYTFQVQPLNVNVKPIASTG